MPRLIGSWWPPLVLLLAPGCGSSPEPMPWLQADATRIVDETGAEVRLRGVNLGGWLFHETWITQVGLGLPARAWRAGHERGIGTEVEAALRELTARVGAFSTCHTGSETWLDDLGAALGSRIDPAAADAFVDYLAGFESLCDDSELPLRRVLEQRFGTDGRDELLDAFQAAWIGEADLAWLAEQGFNTVRVPMGYRSLTTGSDLEDPSAIELNPRALARLDRLLEHCRRHSLYAVLDIQEAPGGQNTYAGEARLYSQPRFQALTVELWEALSDRYRDRPEVAAYSLLAEPYGAPSAAARDEMYDRLVRAVRDRGDRHLLVIHDGFRSMPSLPDPGEWGWQGVIYSTHLFESDLESADGYRQRIEQLYEPVYAQAQARQGVPYYIGSFSTREAAGWAYEAAGVLVDWYEQAGYGWSLWTYKKVPDPALAAVFGYRDAWGLRGRLPAGADFAPPDPQLDGRDELAAKLAAYAGLDLEAEAGLLEALRRPLR